MFKSAAPGGLTVPNRQYPDHQNIRSDLTRTLKMKFLGLFDRNKTAALPTFAPSCRVYVIPRVDRTGYVLCRYTHTHTHHRWILTPERLM